MPLYEYYCLKCEKVYEVLKSLKKYDKVVLCPKCGQPLKKHITAPKNRWRFND